MNLSFRIVALAAALALALPTTAFAATYDRPTLPKPITLPHPDMPPTTAGGGDGTGSNSLRFEAFEDGDMVVALGTATGHAGQWDDYQYEKNLFSTYKPCVLSANTKPVNGVQYESPTKYRQYDHAYGIWVPSATPAQRIAARNYSRAQLGEPYSITSLKNDQSKWYCSKLLWASYKYAGPKIDLDADGGAWVWPVDLINDSQTKVFVSAR